MSDLRQALLGILAALLSSSILLGSMMLALSEISPPVARSLASPTNTPYLVGTPGLGQPTFTASPTALAPTPTTFEATSACPAPPGWVRVTIEYGDNLQDLALIFGTTPEDLIKANCLAAGMDSNVKLIPGSFILVPPASPTSSATITPTPSATATPQKQKQSSRRPSIRCIQRPASWVRYYVRPGDNLWRISQARRTTVEQLIAVNCLKSTVIRVGQLLWVPYIPPTPTPWRTPTSRPATATPTWLPSATPPPTETPIPPPTDTPAPTNTPPAATPTLEPTSPPEPSPYP